MSINKVILIGFLGQDPITRYLANGSAVTNLSIATTEKWKDKKSGETKENTEWHRIVIYNRLAEVAAEYLSKGSKVYIEGKLKTKKWKDKQGIERYTTEIHVNELQMLDNKGEVGSKDGHKQQGKQNTKQNDNYQAAEPDFDDDIPF